MGLFELSLILVIAAIFGVVAKNLKQPLIIGYLFAGMLLGYLGLIGDTEAYSGLGQIGVTLLLFLVGLEMNLKELPSIGKVALITGVGQIFFTSLIGFLLASVLGFAPMSALYIAIALTFSSTIIIVKLLSEKNDLASLYGKISVGFLIVQDIVAILILSFLAGTGNGSLNIANFFVVVIKAAILFAVVWVVSKKILPRIFEKFMFQSQELTLIVSIAWALGVASLVAGPIGFTYEIGGFLAGLALSNLPGHLQVATRTRPLRDFFLTIFFILLGAKLVVGSFSGVLLPALVFSTFVLVGNPIIVMSLLGLMGYKRRTSFMSGLTVAQISEFSFIIVAMGASLGHIGDGVVSTVIVVGVITMTVSTYLILGANKVFAKIGNTLKIFEKSITKEQIINKETQMVDHVVVVGGGKSGRMLTKYLKNKKIPVLLVDFDPSIFNKFTAEKTSVLFGDITDPEILGSARIGKARVVVSTIPTLSDNLVLMEHVRALRKRPQIMMTSLTRSDAVKLYEKGASFVVVPQETAGEYVRHLFRVYGVGNKKIGAMGSAHFKRLVYR